MGQYSGRVHAGGDVHVDYDDEREPGRSGVAHDGRAGQPGAGHDPPGRPASPTRIGRKYCLFVDGCSLSQHESRSMVT